jgi:hypothetical protein
MSLCPRRVESSSTLLWEPQISHIIKCRMFVLFKSIFSIKFLQYLWLNCLKILSNWVYEYEYLVTRLRLYGELHPVAWTASLHGTQWWCDTFRVSYQCQYFTWDVQNCVCFSLKFKHRLHLVAWISQSWFRIAM